MSRYQWGYTKTVAFSAKVLRVRWLRFVREVQRALGVVR